MASSRKQNVVGAEVARQRRALGLGQSDLAARLTRLGWDCSENLVSKIEAGFRRVIDEESVLLARALGLPPGALFPGDSRRKDVPRPLH